MKYLEIKELQIKTNNKTYEKFSVDIANGQVWGIYSKDKGAIAAFLSIVGGINQNDDNVTWNDTNVFDNKQYFKNRIYFDFQDHNLTTIKVESIKDAFSKIYDIKFDEENFKKCLKDLNVRGEYEIGYKYFFTNLGNTLVNYCLLTSLDKNNIIINNPTIYLKDINNIKYIVEGLTNKYKYNTMLIALNNISVFLGKLDYILVFPDYGSPIIVDPLTDVFYVFDNGELPIIQNNKIFDSYDGQRVIIKKDFSDEEIKFLKKSKIHFIKIKIYELENYL